jgi:four helix bundle protein
MSLATSIYETSIQLPMNERYGLASQMRRSAVSIAANLAQAHGRRSAREYLRSRAVARGSLAELETNLMLAAHLGYIDGGEVTNLLLLADEVGRMLGAVPSRLQQRLLNASSPVPSPSRP